MVAKGNYPIALACQAPGSFAAKVSMWRVMLSTLLTAERRTTVRTPADLLRKYNG